VLGHVRDECVHRGVVANVGRESLDLLTELAGGTQAGRLVAAADRHTCAFGDQGPRDGVADPAATAGHEHHAPRQVELHVTAGIALDRTFGTLIDVATGCGRERHDHGHSPTLGVGCDRGEQDAHARSMRGGVSAPCRRGRDGEPSSRGMARS
jgi:hypothetical protein